MRTCLLTFARTLACAALLSAPVGLLASEPEPIWTHAKWSGGVGLEGDMINPLSPAFLPTEKLERGLVGQINIQFTRPKAGSSQGSYSATLLLYDGQRALTYRGRGPVLAHGSMENQSWVAKVPRAADAAILVTLTRPLNSASGHYLLGHVQLGSRQFPLFALPAVFHARSNPLVEPSSTGRANFFVRDSMNTMGTGNGSATISRGGAVRVSATLGDLRKLSLGSHVLRNPQGRLIVSVGRALSGGGFFGGWWVFDPMDPESHWRGSAFSAGSMAPLDILLAAHVPPARSAPVVSWDTGTIDLDAPQADGALSRPASGDVKWTNPQRSRLRALGTPSAVPLSPAAVFDPQGRLNGPNAFNVRLLSFVLNPSTGTASGKISYFFLISASSPAKVSTAAFKCALNQKTGEIEGFVRPRYKGASTGFLGIGPVGN